jgi:hypothetical protein
VVHIRVIRPSAVARVVSAHLAHASLEQSLGVAAQHAAVADRFARKIVVF